MWACPCARDADGRARCSAETWIIFGQWHCHGSDVSGAPKAKFQVDCRIHHRYQELLTECIGPIGWRPPRAPVTARRLAAHCNSSRKRASRVSSQHTPHTAAPQTLGSHRPDAHPPARPAVLGRAHEPARRHLLRRLLSVVRLLLAARQPAKR
eukprot:2394543-Prymnesium_polylepis.1